jgi:hypothetical protein
MSVYIILPPPLSDSRVSARDKKRVMAHFRGIGNVEATPSSLFLMLGTLRTECDEGVASTLRSSVLFPAGWNMILKKGGQLAA